MPKTPPSDVAFTPAVKAEQAKRGSRKTYERVEQGRGWQTTITPDLRAFLADRDSCYLATANVLGQPYIQHRGGPPGFVRVIDDRTLGFADYSGNRQYISIGNLAENPRAFLFFMDYAHQQRIKVWGTARFVEGDDALVDKLMPTDYDAKPERVLLFHIEAWDANCPQHIPQKVDLRDIQELVGKLQARIVDLEAENVSLRKAADTCKR
jgi:predicted pyridoxine 5'-phosphate oxidase superfamily flavin-nucleotide-binding protein